MYFDIRLRYAARSVRGWRTLSGQSLERAYPTAFWQDPAFVGKIVEGRNVRYRVVDPVLEGCFTLKG
ncbi:hypothetical protein A3L02_04845 [Thermococcus celer Vu 13 = JCM 8558]|uniref:Uncharacterized protein n=1 Tax=Thermococcus celer Vu 13 = JCM 8558 TaxID=1293037 RepID=A0A218P1Y1_THECE|nr:hypothetical protein A3L02_04845 [Thermococcus celer Vu 13 = JCM 8558]